MLARSQLPWRKCYYECTPYTNYMSFTYCAFNCQAHIQVQVFSQHIPHTWIDTPKAVGKGFSFFKQTLRADVITRLCLFMGVVTSLMTFGSRKNLPPTVTPVSTSFFSTTTVGCEAEYFWGNRVQAVVMVVVLLLLLDEKKIR